MSVALFCHKKNSCKVAGGAGREMYFWWGDRQARKAQGSFLSSLIRPIDWEEQRRTFLHSSAVCLSPLIEACWGSFVLKPKKHLSHICPSWQDGITKPSRPLVVGFPLWERPTQQAFSMPAATAISLNTEGLSCLSFFATVEVCLHPLLLITSEARCKMYYISWALCFLSKNSSSTCKQPQLKWNQETQTAFALNLSRNVEMKTELLSQRYFF